MDSLSNQKLTNKAGQVLAAETALKDIDIVCFYFSAHWCPPCRQFTPILADFYSDLKDQGAKIEVVFVSSDRSDFEMRQYMQEAHGDWLALPWGTPATAALKAKYNVTGIPCLVVTKKDGQVVSLNGRSDVHSKGTSCYSQWIQ